MKKILAVALVATVLVAWLRAASPVSLPDPAADDPLASSPGKASLVIAGGCFWGIEELYQHVRGVTDAVSGYSGGTAREANYEIVSLGTTGHAESVKVTYDPSQISVGQLLKIFFAVAHDPTQKGGQGPDMGPQYRSVIFVADERQQSTVTQGGDDKACEAADGREHEALGQQLTDQPRASCPERRAHPELAFAGGASCQQEARDVDARDEQDERNGSHQRQRGRPKVAHHLFLDREQLDGTTRVPLGNVPDQLSEDATHLGGCLVERHAVSQPCESRRAAAPPVGP